MIFAHIKARTLGGEPLLADRDVAEGFWVSLRRTWPEALSACVMPTHAHLAVAVPHLVHARRKTGRLLSGTARRLGRRRLWFPADVTRVADTRHLARLVRYHHLNPCADHLVSEPREWAWSTHRGLLGAEVDPWVEPLRLAAALGWSAQGFVERFNAYTVSDPDRGGDPTLPVPVPPSEVPSHPLELIARAAQHSGRWLRPRDQRRMAVLLARRQGHRQARPIAAAFGLGESTVRRLWLPRRGDDDLVRPAAVCLGDERLLRFTG